MEKVNSSPEIQDLFTEMQQIRREIHQNPELLYDLPKTSALVASYLTSLGLEVQKNIGRSGVIGTKRGNEGPTVLFRADMDALPLSKNSDLPFSSAYPGRMHACGHDAHTAMLLVAAKLLSKREIQGTIKFLFQPAEEGGRGAEAMLKDGALEGVDEVYALHVFPLLPVGDICINDKYMSANSDIFTITVRGVGGHASAPHLCTDPLPAAASIIMNAQNIVSREIDSEKRAVITFSSFKGGSTFNVIPDLVTIKGSVRTIEEDVQDHIVNRLNEICNATQGMYGCSVELDYIKNYFPIVNREPATSKGRAAFQKTSSGKNHHLSLMIGEDFSFFTRELPGCFGLLGCGKEGFDHSLHNSGFMLYEETMIIGVTWWVNLAEIIFGS